MPTFHTYQNPNPSALNNPSQGHWEDPRDWPRTYLYISAHDGAQGIHPPAPVYQTSQPSQQAMYYFAVSEAPSEPYLTDASLTRWFREVVQPQQDTMSMESIMDHNLLLLRPVGPIPPLHTLAAPIPLPPPRLIRSISPTRRATHLTLTAQRQLRFQSPLLHLGVRLQLQPKPPLPLLPMLLSRKCQMPPPISLEQPLPRFRHRMPSCSQISKQRNNNQVKLCHTSRAQPHSSGARNWMEVGH